MTPPLRRFTILVLATRSQSAHRALTSVLLSGRGRGKKLERFKGKLSNAKLILAGAGHVQLHRGHSTAFSGKTILSNLSNLMSKLGLSISCSACWQSLDVVLLPNARMLVIADLVRLPWSDSIWVVVVLKELHFG